MENENGVVKQKTSKNALIIFLIILGALVLLSIPTKTELKDGGTVIYESVTWKYEKVHSMNTTGFDTGERLKICGIEVINNVKRNAIPYNSKSTKTDNAAKTTENADLYTTFINNIKTRKNAENVTFTIGANLYKNYLLGTDNKLYVENGDTKIPGTMGSDGMQYTGSTTGIENVVRIFKTYHTPSEGGSYYGLLVLKEDGNLYILRKPEEDNYKLEKLEYKNIVTAFDTITGQGTTYVVDIAGNQYAIK